MKKCELKELQNEIKSNTEKARAFNPLIQAARGLERHGLRWEKACASGTSRELLLAYGMLRNMPYKVIEQKTKDGNGPYSGMILDSVKKYNPEATINDINEWLNRA